MLILVDIELQKYSWEWEDLCMLNASVPTHRTGHGGGGFV